MHRLGAFDKHTLRNFDALGLEPILAYDSGKTRALREQFQLSQPVLANLLNTSLSTIRKREAGDKRPGGPSQKLLSLLERKGIEGIL